MKKLKSSKQAEEIEKAHKKPKKAKRKIIDTDTLIPLGCTPLHLECSGRIEGAFQIGRIENVIGDSSSGKTLLMLTMFAEICKLKHFDDIKLIFDDTEASLEFDIEYLFGSKVYNRIDNSHRSKTVEQFADRISRLLEKGKRFIYVLDSLDGLTSEDEEVKFVENRNKREKGNKTKGSYGSGVPKSLSQFFRIHEDKLMQNQSSIFVISQTRDNIGFGAMFTPKKRSGGNALKFYSAHEMWLACQKKDKEGRRVAKTNTQAKLTKNKLTGNHGEAYFPILFDYGVDDLMSCIWFLCDEGRWKPSAKDIKEGTTIDTKGWLEDPIKVLDLLNQIEGDESGGMYTSLKHECQKVFDEAMDKLRPERKRKYE